MVFKKSDINTLLGELSGIENHQIIKVHEAVLAEKHTTNDDDLKYISDSLVSIGKGILSNTLVIAGEHDLHVKAPSFRVYMSLDNQSDLPYVKVTVSGTPSFKFEFKETLSTRLDTKFKDNFINFLEYTVQRFVITAIAHENVQALNELIESIKVNIIDEDLNVPFDLKFALSDKSIDYISNDLLVLGTTAEKMMELVSPNSSLETFFSDDEGVEYIKSAIEATIKEDWTSSPNPLVFVRKHNKYILPLVTGDLNTRKTKRVDVLIRNSFTLSFDGLAHRNKAIAHKLDKGEDESYISVYKKDAKGEEPVEILSPVNIKSLAYKG